MTEQRGITRAIEVLGERLADTEGFLLDVENQLDSANRELESLRAENRELTEQLEQARAAEEAASSYALKLERRLEECSKANTALKEGGAKKCKKS